MPAMAEEAGHEGHAKMACAEAGPNRVAAVDAQGAGMDRENGGAEWERSRNLTGTGILGLDSDLPLGQLF